MVRDKRSELTDHLIELYCDWRMRCEQVHATYERFTRAPKASRFLAFAAYEAALDQEECAADAYASQISRMTIAA